MVLTKQRALILDIVKNMNGHLSADEIYILAREKLPGIALATVYNNLNALYCSGLIGKVKIPDKADLYDRSPVLHEHIICSKCRCVKDVTIPDFKNQLCQYTGEEIDSYDLSINYTCKKCKTDS